ncbi:hypothetical protein CUB96_11130 [Akkermansia muciniphila]|nr:hypothetical protein CUB96_11130 [Akkermansia muciniphila]
MQPAAGWEMNPEISAHPPAGAEDAKALPPAGNRPREPPPPCGAAPRLRTQSLRQFHEMALHFLMQHIK